MIQLVNGRYVVRQKGTVRRAQEPGDPFEFGDSAALSLTLVERPRLKGAPQRPEDIIAAFCKERYGF